MKGKLAIGLMTVGIVSITVGCVYLVKGGRR